MPGNIVTNSDRRACAECITSASLSLSLPPTPYHPACPLHTYSCTQPAPQSWTNQTYTQHNPARSAPPVPLALLTARTRRRGSQLSSEVSGGRLASASSSDVHAQWSINPSSIKICTNADGSPVKLGQGGFGSVRVLDARKRSGLNMAGSRHSGGSLMGECWWQEGARSVSS